MHVLSVKYAESGGSLPSHDHNCYELLYICEGNIRATAGNKNFILGSGDMLLLGRFEKHDIEVLSPRYRRYVIQISLAGSGDGIVYDRLSTLIFNRTVNCSLQKKELELLLQMMAKEYEKSELFQGQMLDLQLQQLLILLYRVDQTLFPGFTHPNIAVIENLRRRFETDYASSYSMEEIAAEYHLSPSHISHLFKNFTGYSPMAYLTSCRFIAACNMLSTTNTSVNEIVRLCGLGDTSNFCRSFKKRTGISPLDYRERERKFKKEEQ